MPRSCLRRRDGGNGDDSCSWYVISGCNPRNNEDLLSFSKEQPYTTLAVNRYIRAVAPQHHYSTFLLRIGAHEAPHRDTNNGPFPTMIVNLHEAKRKEGLWLQDPLGDTPLTHQHQTIWGTVVDLRGPFCFNARGTLHAGYVASREQAQCRMTLVAFTTLNIGNISPEACSALTRLGFQAPSQATVRLASYEGLWGTPLRLRQLTIREALHLPPQVTDPHDVIEVCDTQDTYQDPD